MVKAYVALAKSAGLDELPRSKDDDHQVNVGVGVNIVLPELSGAKADRLREIMA